MVELVAVVVVALATTGLVAALALLTWVGRTRRAVRRWVPDESW